MNADMHTGTLTDRNRFYDIDLLRFLAALVVVLYHYTFIGYAAGELIPVEFPVFNTLSRYGYLGVHLFFIISGFVIMLSAEGRSPAAFAISRITRIYPGYWVCVTATALTIFWFGGETFRVGLLQYLANMTMLHQNIGFILIRTLTPALPGSAAVALTTAMMLGAAWLVYVLVEKPGTMWLRKSLHHILPRQVLTFAQQQRAENS